MKRIVILLFLVVQFNLIAQINPFSKLSYDYVVAYEYNGTGNLFIRDCLKNNKTKLDSSIQLTNPEIIELETIITQQTAYGSSTSACFDPHFAVVYYKNDTIVATINICIECNYLISTEKIPATSYKQIKVSDEYSHPAKGFSKTTRKKLTQFIQKLGFTKYIKPLSSIYD